VNACGKLPRCCPFAPSSSECVCVRQVLLAYSRVPKAGLDLKAATLVLIEKGSKDRWGIEFWVTEKVNRSIHAYKRDRILLITP
jgi:hypothetical protein